MIFSRITATVSLTSNSTWGRAVGKRPTGPYRSWGVCLLLTDLLRYGQDAAVCVCHHPPQADSGRLQSASQPVLCRLTVRATRSLRCRRATTRENVCGYADDVRCVFLPHSAVTSGLGTGTPEHIRLPQSRCLLLRSADRRSGHRPTQQTMNSLLFSYLGFDLEAEAVEDLKGSV